MRPGDSQQHQGKGWEAITERAIVALAERGGPCAAILWGRHAQSLKPLLGPVPVGRVGPPLPAQRAPRVLRVEALQRVNRLLEEQGGEPVDWTLPTYDDVPPR